MKTLKKYRIFLLLLTGLILLTLLAPTTGKNAFRLAGNSIMNMLSLLPPVLVLVGLLDVWVPKEVMMKYMGNGSGFKGIFFSLLLGFVAAGPLYISFPVATLLIKKGAALRYVVFFIGVWTTAKLPVFIYELTSFGYEFTAIHIIFGLTFYYFVGMAFEKIFAEKPIAIEE